MNEKKSPMDPVIYREFYDPFDEGPLVRSEEEAPKPALEKPLPGPFSYENIRTYAPSLGSHARWCLAQ